MLDERGSSGAYEYVSTTRYNVKDGGTGSRGSKLFIQKLCTHKPVSELTKTHFISAMIQTGLSALSRSDG